MTELFGPFLQQSANGDFSQWRQLHHFGERMPESLGDDPNSLFLYSFLETNNSEESGLRAVSEGKLTIYPPNGFLQDLDIDDLGVDEVDDPIDETTLTIYLTPTLSKLQPDFIAAIRPLAYEALDHQETDDDLVTNINVLQCFVYLNVDANSVREVISPGLGELLDKNNLTPKEKQETEELKKRWEKFLNGKSSKLLKLGDNIGNAGNPILFETQSLDVRQVGFGVLTKYGRHDPGFFFQISRDYASVENNQLVDELYTDVLGIHWPLIPYDSDPEQVGTDTLYPYSALIDYKEERGLTYRQWRDIGSRQKALYLQRLKRRVRPSSIEETDVPRFKFNMEDFNNLFQIEAIVEYFMNDPEPWDADKSPTDSDSEDYKKIEFTALYGVGVGATATGKEVTLPDAQDLKRITVGLDVITLDADTATSSKQYRIIGVDTASKKVTVDREPNLSGASAWKIRHRPQLVLIDAFGARINGSTATSTEINKQIKLSDLSEHQIQELKKINENFDTIELDVHGSDKSLFRILKAEVKESTKEAFLTVNATLQDIPTSGVKWHIPAGVGGRRDSRMKSPRKKIKKSPGKAGSGGWDHYDGQMFVIAEDRVKKSFLWSSYTSRGKVGGEYNLSSIKGNQNYKVDSYHSNKRKFIFRVTDSQSHLIGNRIEKIEGRTGKPKRLLYEIDVYLEDEVDADLSDTLLKKSLDKSKEKAKKKAAKKKKPKVAEYYGKRVTFYSEDSQPVSNSPHVIKEVLVDTNEVALKKSTKPPSGPSAWRVVQYDGSHEASYYFGKTVETDSAPLKEIPPHGTKYLGKQLIRLHYGGIESDGRTKKINGSAGCLVSPDFVEFRRYLIQYHLSEYAYFYDAKKTQAEALRLLSIASKQKVSPGDLSRKLGRDIKKLKDSWKKFLQELKKIDLEDISTDKDDLEQLNENLENLINNLDYLEKDSNLDELLSEASSENLKALILSLGDIAELLAKKEMKKLIASKSEAQEEYKKLEPAIKKHQRLIKKELESLKSNWTTLIYADLWLIRPDERPKPQETN